MTDTANLSPKVASDDDPANPDIVPVDHDREEWIKHSRDINGITIVRWTCQDDRADHRCPR